MCITKVKHWIFSSYNPGPRQFFTMTLPSKYQNGSIDSSVKGVYRASPIKLMIYGSGKYNCVDHIRKLTNRYRHE
jgi:hypothetical protein